MNAPKMHPLAQGIRAELKPWQTIAALKAAAAAARDRPPTWRERVRAWWRRAWKRMTGRTK